MLYVAMTRAKDMLIMTYASRYLTKRLEAIARQVTLGSNTALSQEADCLGHWILMAAMVRTEAGELFFLSPGRAAGGDSGEGGAPGGSGFHQRGPVQELEARCFRLRQGAGPLPDVQTLLSFQYPHQSAVQAPPR